MSNIFGIDMDKEYNAKDVRDAIVTCFEGAHSDELRSLFKEICDFDEDDEKLLKQNTSDIVKKAFKETGGDYDNPTKESLYEVIDFLKDFSKTFRKKEIIEKNYNKMKKLIDNL